MKTIPWLEIAKREAGIRTFPKGASNSRVEEYHRSVSNAAWDDKVPWCSSFLYWCMKEAGIEGARSALARAWLNWGNPLTEPVHGSVVVLWRDRPDSPKGHVGLFLTQNTTHVHLWGGNQLDEVREHTYPKTMILGCRWPDNTGLED